MRALWIARYGLLLSGVVYAATLILGLLHIGHGEWMFGLGIWAALGIGVCAVLCVVLQFVILPSMRSKT
ncbi:MAG: hypothetical protein WDM91_12080 [Rhizomicrobium sp.]